MARELHGGKIESVDLLVVRRPGSRARANHESRRVAPQNWDQRKSQRHAFAADPQLNWSARMEIGEPAAAFGSGDEGAVDCHEGIRGTPWQLGCLAGDARHGAPSRTHERTRPGEKC